jgi:hypothetical protein
MVDAIAGVFRVNPKVHRSTSVISTHRMFVSHLLSAHEYSMEPRGVAVSHDYHCTLLEHLDDVVLHPQADPQDAGSTPPLGSGLHEDLTHATSLRAPQATSDRRGQ